MFLKAISLLLIKLTGFLCYNVNDGDQLPRAYVVDTIATLAPAWYVSFEVKPFAKVTGWSNILHFTADHHDISTYGSRIPGVWFISDSTKLYICSAVNGNRDYCYQHQSNLPLHQYTTVKIYQKQKTSGEFVYRIKINDVSVHSVINSQPKYFNDVSVYRSDRWYVPASAQVRNLVYGNLPNKFGPLRNTIIKSYDMFFAEYDVSFEIEPLGIIQSWSSILHVTKGANNNVYGDRIPGIWFRPGTNKLHICSAVNNNRNYVYNGIANIPKNKFTKIRVSQTWENNKYRYSIFVNDQQVHTVINNNPVILTGVKAYLGDPWYRPAKAMVRNVVVKTSQGGGFSPKKSNIFSRIQHVGPQYYVSFDVQPTAVPTNKYTSIVHMTLGGNIGRIGDRMPGVWFRPSSQKLHICMPVNGEKNYCLDTDSVPLNQFTNVQIRQTWDVKADKYTYVIAVNGVVIHTVVNEQAQEFDNVVMYTSDPWYQPAQAIVKNLVFKNLPNGYTYDGCLPARTQVTDCNSFTAITSFRSIDGTCNNLNNPTWGSSETPLRRLVEPEYAADGKLDTPRGFPGTNPVLPPSNDVSQQLFQVEGENTGSSKYLTTLFMTFGQFIDHDVTATPHSSCKQSCDSFNAWQYPCFPMLFNHSSTCSPNGRSTPVCSNQAYMSHRQQRNGLSAFIDGSQIYSNDVQHFSNLRSNTDGKMKITIDNLLPIAQQQNTAGCPTKGGCSLVGDFRGDENIALHSMHTLFVRQHNRIAAELKLLNPSWDDERLFQTSRKINGALWQHITYNEYVPLLATLTPYSGYEAAVNPSITNVFATAAFRYGHSLIPNEFSQLDNNFDEMHDAVLLQDAFFNRQIINDRGIEPTLRGLIGNMSNDVDNSFSFAVARKLFIGVGGSGYLDLTALNIQRGRDHGLPSYNKFRKYCGLTVAKTWADIESFMLGDAAGKFKTIYEHLDDIDLFAAGISEKHLPDLQVGPTFNCLLSKQFTDLRDGDRHYYENPGVFTRSQLNSIKAVTMATILCDNIQGLVSIQPDAFHIPDSDNLRRTCASIIKLDLQPWSGVTNQVVADEQFLSDDIENEVDTNVDDQKKDAQRPQTKKDIINHIEKNIMEKQRMRDDDFMMNDGDNNESLDEQRFLDELRDENDWK